MYQEIKIKAKLNRIKTEGEASFPIIFNFNFFNNKKY